MRPDLAKCTTERERRGAKGKCFKTKYRGRVRVHPDPEHDYLNEYGGYRSSARHRQWESKEFTDVLNPLRGAIRKNLGRPWDKVFSEFCKVLDRRGVSGYHIWTHLMQEVITKTYLQNGKIYEISKYGSSPAEVDGFYVHPESGLLQYRDRRWTKRELRKRWSRKAEIKIPVPGMEPWYYTQIDGLWFRCLAIMQKNLLGTTEVIFRKASANRKEIVWIKSQLEV